MWNNNKDVQFVYSTHGPQQVWAIFDGMPGWKRAKVGSADGVQNVAEILTTAKAYGRKVNVYLTGDDIERVVML
jgi:serine/threonine protein phosphatase PrpC